MLFLVLPASEGGGLYWLGALLTVVSNVALGTSIVFYNSYMPLLVEGTPEVLAKRAEGGDAEKLQRLRSEYESEYSQKGMGWGYAGGTTRGRGADAAAPWPPRRAGRRLAGRRTDAPRREPRTSNESRQVRPAC